MQDTQSLHGPQGGGWVTPRGGLCVSRERLSGRICPSPPHRPLSSLTLCYWIRVSEGPLPERLLQSWDTPTSRTPPAKMVSVLLEEAG